MWGVTLVGKRPVTAERYAEVGLKASFWKKGKHLDFLSVLDNNSNNMPEALSSRDLALHP